MTHNNQWLWSIDNQHWLIKKSPWQFSMVCTLVNHGNDNHGNLSGKFWTFWYHFHSQWKYIPFVFCNNIYSFVAISIEVSWKIVSMRERKTNCASAQDHLLAMSLIFGELRLNLLHFFFLFQKICVKVFYQALNLQAFPSALGKQA